MTETRQQEEQLSPQELLDLTREVAQRGETSGNEIMRYSSLRGIANDRLVMISHTSRGGYEGSLLVSPLGAVRITKDSTIAQPKVTERVFDKGLFRPAEILRTVEPYHGAWILSATSDLVVHEPGIEGFRLYDAVTRREEWPTEYFIPGKSMDEAADTILRAFELSGNFMGIEQLAFGGKFLRHEMSDDARFQGRC